MFNVVGTDKGAVQDWKNGSHVPIGKETGHVLGLIDPYTLSTMRNPPVPKQSDAQCVKLNMAGHRHANHWDRQRYSSWSDERTLCRRFGKPLGAVPVIEIDTSAAKLTYSGRRCSLVALHQSKRS